MKAVTQQGLGLIDFALQKVQKLPAGSSVTLKMVSAGGDSKKSAEQTKAMLEQMNLQVTEYVDIKP